MLTPAMSIERADNDRLRAECTSLLIRNEELEAKVLSLEQSVERYEGRIAALVDANAKERALVLRWLRGIEHGAAGIPPGEWRRGADDAVQCAANAIERGDHERLLP